MQNEKGPLSFVDVDWAGITRGDDLFDADKTDARQMSVEITVIGKRGPNGYPVVRAVGARGNLEQWLMDLYTGGTGVGEDLFEFIKFVH